MVALTGVPGTGKTTIAHALLARNIPIVDLNEFARAEGFLRERDEKRDAFVVDTKKLAKRLASALATLDDTRIVIEGHFAHDMDVDAIALLRCDPLVLVERLRKRGYKEEKVRENAEVEALDVLAAEVLDRGLSCAEFDVTRLGVEEAAAAVSGFVEGRPKGFKRKTVGSAAWRVETLPWF